MSDTDTRHQYLAISTQHTDSNVAMLLVMHNGHGLRSPCHCSDSSNTEPTYPTSHM
jgi:hypothetical protein